MKKGNNIKLSILTILFVFGAIMFIYGYREVNAHPLDKANLIRLHVIANSDSVYDQKVKLQVRDRIIKYMSPFLNKTTSVEEARAIVLKKLPNVAQEANSCLNSLGTSYSAHVQLADFTFPTKAYGDLVLPAGEYEALRVVLGEGKGRNWWCVLYPPLCFIDISNTIAVETNNIEISSSSEESQLANGPPVQVEVRFKVVDKLRDFLLERSLARADNKKLPEN